MFKKLCIVRMRGSGVRGWGRERSDLRGAGCGVWQPPTQPVNYFPRKYVPILLQNNLSQQSVFQHIFLLIKILLDGFLHNKNLQNNEKGFDEWLCKDGVGWLLGWLLVAVDKQALWMASFQVAMLAGSRALLVMSSAHSVQQSWRIQVSAQEGSATFVEITYGGFLW